MSYWKRACVFTSSAALLLALSLGAAAYADDDALAREGNAALAQKDYGTAFSVFSILARRGYPTAQYDVGVFYLNGQGVQRDEKQAFYWFRRSAAQGNALALQVLRNGEANGNGNATNASRQAAQSTPGNSSSEPGNKAGANVAAVAPAAGAGDADPPPASRFSLGASLGHTGKLTGIHNSDSIGLLAGYKFNSSFGVELAYSELYRNANANGFVSATYPGTTGTFDLSAASLTGQYTYPLSSTLSLLGNLGFHSSRYKIKTPAAVPRAGSSSGLVAGLKLEYDLASNIGIRAGFDTYDESGDVTGTITEVQLAIVLKF